MTQPLNVDGLQPPPWLGERLRSDAPTVLVPIVRARRRRRLVAGIVAAAIGVLAGVVYGVTRPLSPRQMGTSASPAVAAQPPAVTAPAPSPTLLAAPSTAPEAQTPAVAAPPPSAMIDEKTTQPATDLAPIVRVQAVARRAHPAPSAPSAWLKSEPPKAWFK